MKKLFLAALVCLFAITANGQPPQVRVENNTQDELFEMFRIMGVRALRYDLSAFSDKTYQFTLYIEEFAEGQQQNNIHIFNLGANWDDISEYAFENEQQRNKFIETKIKVSDDGKRVLFCDKASLIIAPKNDSTATLGFNLYGLSSGSLPLKLKTLENSRRGPMYDLRPMKIYPLGEGKEHNIPLLFYSSFWYDAKSNVFRSCMESEIDPALSADYVKNIPHYYVIGIIAKEM